MKTLIKILTIIGAVWVLHASWPLLVWCNRVLSKLYVVGAGVCDWALRLKRIAIRHEGDFQMITATPITETSWPKNVVKTVETRKRDVVVRIADWTRQRTGEPAYDVEIYVHGVYDWNESKTFCVGNKYPHQTSKAEARRLAVKFAQEQIAKFL